MAAEACELAVQLIKDVRAARDARAAESLRADWHAAAYHEQGCRLRDALAENYRLRNALRYDDQRKQVQTGLHLEATPTRAPGTRARSLRTIDLPPGRRPAPRQNRLRQTRSRVLHRRRDRGRRIHDDGRRRS